MASALSARLDRTDSSTPWGFRLHGGKDFSSPLTIQRVTPGSLAAKCGLQVGDVILKIGDRSTDSLRHKEAQSAVIASGNSLDLSIKRGGAPVIAPSVDSYQPSTPSYGGYNNPAPQSYSTNYNVKPKPFAPGGFSSVDGLSSTTANLNLGPGNDQDDVSSSHGSEDLPPPPPPMHEGGGRMHDPPPPAPPAPPPAHTASFSTPSPWKPSSGVSKVGGTDVTKSVSVAGTRTPTGGTKAPVSTPTQSAVFEEEHDADDVPKYRGYTNPSVQSRTFKMLQQQVDSGEENPGSGLVKPTAQTTPVQPIGKPSDQGRVKAIMNRQYNTPSKLYSDKNAKDTFSEQSTNIIENLQREDQVKQTPPQDGKKAYVASDTFRMVQEMDGKEPGSEPAKPRSTAFNPLTGKYGSALRGDDAEYKADDPNSPLYRPTESASYKASQPVEGAPTKGATYPMPPHAPSKPFQPTPRPEPTIVGTAYPSQDAADTIIQNRSTITIAPRPGSNTNAASTPSAFKQKGPKPFSSGFPADSAPGSVPKPSAAPPAPAGGTWNPSVPTGPRQMRVGKMGEARSMPATGGAGRIPICNDCGTAIRGPFVLALDKSWCPDHFNCANPSCRCPLIDCGFVEEDGQLYCEKDYEQFLAPKCGKCGSAIVGEIVNAMKNQYHMHCFLCVQCHQPIGTGSFHIEEGKVYCQKDWAQLFQTKCYGCQFPIEPGDRWVEALGQNWHSECFNCSTCQVNLEGQPFYAKAGKPFCKKHAQAGGGRFG